MKKRDFAWLSALQIRNLLAVALLCLLTSCGGGGSDSSGIPVSAPGTLTGQVVKGLTSGAAVSLYSLTDSGQRTLLGSSFSNAQGSFSLRYILQPGRVYLLEAVGGQYVNEISNLSETLTTPMRTVFVASGAERYFSVSPVSETVAIEIDQIVSASKWSASSVANVTSRVNTAFDLPSPFDLRFLDLTMLPPGGTTSLSDAEVAFSFQIGNFAGFWHELRLRSPGLTLAQGLNSFHAVMVGNSQDENLSIALIAGLIRFVEKVPALAQSKSALYASIGLPSDANTAQFSGGESSGQSLASIPNWALRFLSPPGMGSSATTDTVFSSRGALVAYRLGLANSGSGFSHVGYASVADVYGTSETAIGRWNRGYYYPLGVTYDSVNNRFVAPNRILEPLISDMVYAAGIPATNLPICRTVVMSPRAQTKDFATFDNSRTVTLDASSRIIFQHLSGSTLVRYNIVLRDNSGARFVVENSGGVDAPFQGDVLPGNKEFSPSQPFPLPSGETLTVKGMLAGNGGTKAVISIATNIHTLTSSGALSAAFETVSSTQDCQPVSFSSGTVSPIPATGDYFLSMMNRFFNVMSLAFFPNGTPNYIAVSGVTANSGVEKAGNDLFGIGVMLPPFSYSGNPSLVPQPYIYIKLTGGSSLPVTGSASYRLIASTPYLIKSSNQLISADRSIQSANLTILFGQYPLGTVNPNYGTCQLTINGRMLPYSGNRAGEGICLSDAVTESFDGGIAYGDNRYAVIKYTRLYGGDVQGQASLLLEKIP